MSKGGYFWPIFTKIPTFLTFLPFVYPSKNKTINKKASKSNFSLKIAQLKSSETVILGKNTDFEIKRLVNSKLFNPLVPKDIVYGNFFLIFCTSSVNGACMNVWGLNFTCVVPVPRNRYVDISTCGHYP